MVKKSFGASLSTKQCHSFDLRPVEVIKAAFKDLGLRRFRLMSYWDEIEAKPGVYDFSGLDKQISAIEAFRGEVSLCLGVRQPRWPESHWPSWAQELSPNERNKKLENFIRKTVERYDKSPSIHSYQLENEALNRTFGVNGEFDRRRLRSEFALVRELSDKPIIMTTSNTWGLPLRQPCPDIYGFSLYRIQYHNGAYRRSWVPGWWHPLRAKLIRLTRNRPVFIHELQCEPWGPVSTWEMSSAEQAKSMSLEQLRGNLNYAKQTGLYPIDLWGLEWWYWRKQHGDPAPWKLVKEFLNS